MFKAVKPVVQVALLIVGIAMVCFGVMRGEADAVLAKAIRLCLECIGIGKKKKHRIASFGAISWIDSGVGDACDQYSPA